MDNFTDILQTISDPMIPKVNLIRIFEKLITYIIETTNVELDDDGLEQCLVCLKIDDITDIVYDTPTLRGGKLKRRHFPINATQFLYGLLILLMLEKSGHKCDITPQGPYIGKTIMAENITGSIEIVTDFHILYLTGKEIIYENYDSILPHPKNYSYDNVTEAIKRITNKE